MTGLRSNKRLSRPLTEAELSHVTAVQQISARTTSRPSSPLYVDSDSRNARTRYAGVSPRENAQREQAGTYFSQSSKQTGATPTEAPQTVRFFTRSAAIVQTPQTSRFAGQQKLEPASADTSSTNRSALPQDKFLIRVIFEHGNTSVFSVEGCKTAEDIVSRTLKKGAVGSAAPLKSYCFYVLDGTEPKSAYCRRLSESELVRICADKTRTERERLILRKIHAGEPEGLQLTTAAGIAVKQLQQTPTAAVHTHATRSQLKIHKLTGESLPSLSYPMSPATVADRERHLYSAARDLERPDDHIMPAPRPRPRKNKEFDGGRPPSELVVADPQTYFPDAPEEELEAVRRMSMRRSKRLSHAASRLSTVSNLSVASILQNAPPVPTVSDTWFDGTNILARVRPMSMLRSGPPASNYRDSLASSMLEPLDEESPLEPNRKSYVSFGAESAPDSATISITDTDGNTVQQSYFDDAGSSSISEQLSQAIAEDGEEEDVELNEFLKNDSWDNVKYIRGKLIGQGSFGSVYLALHAFTAQLMAVKQVEIPSNQGAVIDAKKNNMVEALKREIALLRELKHPHIVQYLGSSSDANNLNIFLEYIPGGSIAKMLVEYGSLNEHLVVNFVRQILVGLAYLHSKDIIHRDIKGANILVDNHGAVKISDFGISKRVQDSKTLLSEGGSGISKGRMGLANNRVSLQGSVFWMAPEVVKQTAYTRKADIWSLGCLIVEMLTGSHPHPNMTQLQAIFKIGGRGVGGAINDPSPEVPPNASREAKDFLRRTFAVEYEKRPEAEELLGMAFLKPKA